MDRDALVVTIRRGREKDIVVLTIPPDGDAIVDQRDVRTDTADAKARRANWNDTIADHVFLNPGLKADDIAAQVPVGQCRVFEGLAAMRKSGRLRVSGTGRAYSPWRYFHPNAIPVPTE